MDATSGFVARLGPAARDRLMASGVTLELAKGDRLLKRGDPGGDVFIVEAGALEVVDDRFRPEVVLDTVGPGDVVGDMAFVDEAPRAADVRATTEVRCRRFDRPTLAALLERDAEVAAAFYRALTERMAFRHREMTATAAVGGLGRRGGARRSAGLPWTTRQAGELAARARAVWAQAQRTLPGAETQAAEQIREATVELAEDASAWLVRYHDAELSAEAGGLLAEELQGWWVRTGFGRAGLGVGGPAAQERLRAWALDGVPGGDARIGQPVDAALLGLPSFQRLRQDRAALLAAVRAVGPPPKRILALSVNPGSLLEAAPASAEVILFGGTDAGQRPTVRIEADLFAHIHGRQRLAVDPVDLVVVDGLLEHMADAEALGLFSFLGRVLRPGGRLFAIHAHPAPDEPFVRDVLAIRWIRRRVADLIPFAAVAGFDTSASDSAHLACLLRSEGSYP